MSLNSQSVVLKIYNFPQGKKTLAIARPFPSREAAEKWKDQQVLAGRYEFEITVIPPRI
jgi:hypothetical protein